MEMGFGKHRSREVRWVIENDPSYVEWILAHTAGPEDIRDEFRLILGEGRSCPDCDVPLTLVVWGMPAPGFGADRTQPVELAGCVVPPSPAAWKCPSCQRGFRRDLSPGNLGF